MRTIAIILGIGVALVGCGEEKPTRKSQPAQQPITDTPMTPVTSDVIPPVTTTETTVPATTGTGTIDIAALMAANPQFAKLIADNPNLASYFAALAANNSTSSIPSSTSPGAYSYSYTCLGNTCLVTENGVTKTIPISELKALPKN